jgi:hypothetical protein
LSRGPPCHIFRPEAHVSDNSDTKVKAMKRERAENVESFSFLAHKNVPTVQRRAFSLGPFIQRAYTVIDTRQAAMSTCRSAASSRPTGPRLGSFGGSFLETQSSSLGTHR